MLRRLFSSENIAIAYLILAIALLTLNPFQLQAYDPAEWWVGRFWLSDMGQNILLFLPLGMLLRHRFRMPYGLCLVSGCLLSFAIESAQLFIAVRTSNFVDLIANSTGSCIGAWLYQLGINNADRGRDNPSKRSNNHCWPCPNLTLAIMLLPLCWTRAITTAWQPHGGWILLPNVLALLALLQASPSQLCMPKTTQYMVLLLALCPLSFQKMLLPPLVAGASISILALGNHRGISSKHLSIGAIAIGFGLITHRNSIWLRSQSPYMGETWYNLLWIEILLSLIVLMSAFSLDRVGKKKLTKT